MSQIHKHPIPANIAERCLINPEQYKAQYQQSITDPDTFWGEQGKILDWIRPYTRVKNTSFAPGNISIKWYEDGTLNLAANCLDRHLAERGDQTAIIWEGDDASQSKHITYRELHADVCRFANVLLDLGIKKGDVVAIYMPMVPEAAVAMLACARIGAIHSVIFGIPMRFLAMATVSVLCPLTTSPFKADSRIYSANLRLAFLALSLNAS